MNNYITTKEYADIMGISERTVRRQIARGDLQAKEIPHPKRSDLKAFLVYFDDKNADTSIADIADTNADTSIADIADTNADTPIADTADTKTADTPIADTKIDTPSDNLFDDNADTADTPDLITHNLPLTPQNLGALSVLGGKNIPSSDHATNNSQLIAPNSIKGRVKLSEKQERIGLRRSQLCEELHSFKSAEKLSLTAAISAYLELYNTGAHQSVIHATLGDISPSTLRRWYNSWLSSDRDWRTLIPEWRSGVVGHEVPEEDFNWLIGVLHSDGKPPVSAALRFWHTKLRMEGRTPPVSDRTMQRAIKVFAERHAARWAYMRRGAKYFRENYLPHVLQDGTRIPVGDLYYSDGCTLNFDVLNPYTGKPCRPTFVPFMDYTSGMITGFDLDFSENRRVIASAYRNAITTWGFVPLYIKWDNGRAYRSLQNTKLTRAQLAELKQLEQDEIAEISGNIYATGVQEILNSLPYNPTGKAKIERFFGILDGGLERFLPGYRGASITDKPAHLMRNEKHLQLLNEKLKGNLTLTPMEAKQVLNWWILEVYAHMDHPTISGKTRLEVWLDGIKSIDESRRKAPDELWYLMLSEEVKKLDRGGVKVRGIWYYDEALFDYVGRKVYVRYDQMDERYVFIYDELKQPICRALMRDVHDPLVTVRGSEEAKMRFTNEMKQKNRLEKRMRRDAEELASLTRDGGMFMMEAINKVRSMPSASIELTNITHALPDIIEAPASEQTEKPAPNDDKENDVVIPREFLDAIGVRS